MSTPLLFPAEHAAWHICQWRLQLLWSTGLPLLCALFACQTPCHVAQTRLLISDESAAAWQSLRCLYRDPRST